MCWRCTDLSRGLLTAEWKDTETGRAAKFYKLTARGRARLKTETANWEQLSGAIQSILGVVGGKA